MTILIKIRISEITHLFFFWVFLAHSQESSCPNAIVMGDVNSENYQVIFPLGWSESGNFSYILQDINPLAAAAIYDYKVIVQDMITDSILWKKEIIYDLENKRPEDYGLSSNQIPRDETLYNVSFFKQVVWKFYGDEIVRDLHHFTIKRANSTLNPISQLKEKGFLLQTKEKELIEDYVIDYTIEIIFGKKRKTVFHHVDPPLSEEKRKSIWYKRYRISGYFLSPFENRIALVAFTSVPGYEEPFEYPFLVGVNLDSGF